MYRVCLTRRQEKKTGLQISYIKKVKAAIIYNEPGTSYLASNPSEITVTDVGGLIYRKRNAMYDYKGNLVRHEALLSGNEYAFTQISYDAYGNIASVTYLENNLGQEGVK